MKQYSCLVCLYDTLEIERQSKSNSYNKVICKPLPHEMIGQAGFSQRALNFTTRQDSSLKTAMLDINILQINSQITELNYM